MLVRLYDLPDDAELGRQLARQGTQIRRAMAYEKDVVGRWVEGAFGERASGWRNECEVAFARSPLACHIAVRDAAMVGFACYDSTCKNFLGPIGVAADCRGAGIGKLFAMSRNTDFNHLACAYFAGEFGRNNVYSLPVAVEAASSVSTFW